MPQSLPRDLALDFVLEVALGTPPELWLGEPGEGPAERAARLDAAADILADDPDQPGADFLRGLLAEDRNRLAVCTAPDEPDEGDDVEWLEAA